MLNTSSMIFILQSLCCMSLFFMYCPQISKISHKHSVKDLSLVSNATKWLLTVVSTAALLLSNNNAVVVASQYVSLILNGIILLQIMRYGIKKETIKNVVFILVSLIALFLLINSNIDCITKILIIQVITLVSKILEFVPQIVKIHKTKSVGDISPMYWWCKVLYTVMSIAILILAMNSMIIVVTQAANLGFSAITLRQVIHYSGHKH